MDKPTAALLMGISPQWLGQKCARGEIDGAVKEGGRWLLSAPWVNRHAASRYKQADLDSLRIMEAPKRDEAIRRLGLVQQAIGFAIDAPDRGAALGAFAVRHKIRQRTLERWIGRYKDEGILGLVDRRRGGIKREDVIEEEAWQTFCALYLDQRKMTVKLCYEMTRTIAEREGRDWQLPTVRTMHNLIERRIPKNVRVLHREGRTAYEAKCAPFIEIDPDSIAPGSVWVGDHSPFNCWVRHRNGWIRPWITAWQDMRSRAIVGRDINAGPNQTTILRAFKRGCQEYGPPDAVKIDNGKDYDSEMWTGTTKQRRRAINKGYLDESMMAGIYALLDISVSFAIPYNAKAKPIERFFDTLDRQFVVTLDSYCGKDPQRRPEEFDLNDTKLIESALTLEEFADRAGKYIDECYNRRGHTGRGMEGDAPLTVLNRRSSRRAVPDEILDLLCRVWSGELTVG